MSTVTLINNETGAKAEFPILKSTMGSDVIDIATLHKQMGMYTYDPGLTMTASCESEITYIDGGKGELFYRGYPIEYLADNHRFIEVCYLILHGELPSESEFNVFKEDIKENSFIHEGLYNLFSALPDKAHPMAILASAVSALTAIHFDHLNIKDEAESLFMARKLIAKIPTLIASSYRWSIGRPFIYPDMNKGYTENFLHMLRSKPNNDAVITETEIEALDTIFSLHADHEQNASTTAVRLVASTGAHPYAAISAGINTLWGRAHGGANESVVEQLELIGSVDRVEEFIKKAKDPNDPFRLMGFGHRVYKSYDPRATILKKLQDKLKTELNLSNKLLDVAHKVEQIALSDEYFVSRGLYPNVDFYSGVILLALGIPRKMFTCIFVLGRIPGWIAQWIEFKKDTKAKITRPRQRYIGPLPRK